MLKSSVKNIVRNHKFIVYQISKNSLGCWDQTSTTLVGRKEEDAASGRRRKEKRDRSTLFDGALDKYLARRRATHTSSSSNYTALSLSLAESVMVVQKWKSKDGGQNSFRHLSEAALSAIQDV